MRFPSGPVAAIVHAAFVAPEYDVRFLPLVVDALPGKQPTGIAKKVAIETVSV